ncbi:MAG: haloacid dehalogenase-like hydrolase [Bacteroidales bacterium]
MKILPRSLVVITIFFFFQLITGCSKTESRAGDSLDRLNWSERNYHLLNQMIADNGIGGKYYQEGEIPYIVLDWDQTCAHFDVEEALMRYQLFNLRFKCSVAQFKSVLKDTINEITRLSDEYRGVRLADINTDLMNDYQFILDNYQGFNGKMTLEEIKATPRYNDFVARMLFLADGYMGTKGIGLEYVYMWELYLFAGFTVEEVRAMAKEAISYELANQIGRHSLESPAGLTTLTGRVSCSFNSGLRVFPEMQNFITTCRDHGIEVYIVSASYKPVVEVFGGIGTFGYNLPADHVIGMELAIGPDGKIIPEYKAGWVKTVRAGKVEAINLVIKTQPGKNHDPLFAGGDSDGDIEMLTQFPGMKLGLIWNRLKGGEIGQLCKQAVDEMNLPNPRFILQGRNENVGIVRPSSETILMGKTEPQLLP